MGSQDVGIVDAGRDCHEPNLISRPFGICAVFTIWVIGDKFSVLQKKEARVHPGQGTDHILLGDRIFHSGSLSNRFLKGDWSFRFSDCLSCSF